MILALDCETTTYESGNPFSERNKLCVVGCFDGSSYGDYCIEYSNHPYGRNLKILAGLIEEAELLVGFNLKFDLAWLKRYIPDIRIPPVWDCQIAEYLLTGQSHIFPSLNECLEKYGLPLKLDEVKEMWEQGFDTPDIPLDILLKYLKRDVMSTYDLYMRQKNHKELHNMENLLELSMKDSVILGDMEKTGIKFDPKSCEKDKDNVEKEITKILETLDLISETHISWKSPKQVSIYLFGGTINEKPYPQILQPEPNSESDTTIEKSDEEINRENEIRATAKPKKAPIQRVWSVSEGSLLKLRPKAPKKIKKIIDLLLEFKKKSKLVDTYLQGIPDTVRRMDWTGDLIHGTFNATSTRTGRLSSTKPNLQNFPPGMQKHVYSRFI